MKCSGAAGAVQQFAAGGAIDHQIPHFGEAVRVVNPVNQLGQRLRNIRAEAPLRHADEQRPLPPQRGP